MSEFDSLEGGNSDIEGWFSELIINADMARPRSRQGHIGPSEAGNPCDRAIAYRLAGAQRINFPDTLRANIGTGFHEYIASALDTVNLAVGQRYLIEHPIEYRGVRGSVDIFDRRHGRCVDVKTTTMRMLRRIKFKGSPETHRVQTQIYAAGLVEAGENVRSVTLLYIPVDGTLADVYAATAPFDRVIADDAIDRLDAIGNSLADGFSPETLSAYPTPLCGWCPFYSPGRPATPRSCPGGTLEEAASSTEEVASST